MRISLEMKSAEAPARTPIRLKTFTVSAWDGLPLHVREWRGNGGGPPVLGLPGFVRTSGDFSAVAEALNCARMVSLDYPGRGQSGRSHDVRRYAPEACLGDVLDVCAALHLHGVAVLGTSFGGLLAMGLGAARPGLLRAVVLNDVGPEIGRAGADFVGRYVGEDPALPDLEACIAYLRASLPPLSLSGEEDWRQMGRLTYGPGPDGRWHPLWDTRIVRLLREPPPDLWPMFRALAHIPLLLVRGGTQRDPAACDRRAHDRRAAGHAGRYAAPYRPRPDPDRAGGVAGPARLPGGGRMTVARLIAGFFGCGRFPVTPGSAGSLAAILIGWPLMLGPAWVLPSAALLAVLAGLWAVAASGITDDPGWVVIDEVAGQWIALVGLARPTPLGLLAAFVLFRIIDVAKPGPVGWADRQHGPAGVMADDVIAGAIAAGILWAARSRWPELLG